MYSQSLESRYLRCHTSRSVAVRNEAPGTVVLHTTGVVCDVFKRRDSLVKDAKKEGKDKRGLIKFMQTHVRLTNKCGFCFEDKILFNFFEVKFSKIVLIVV